MTENIITKQNFQKLPPLSKKELPFKLIINAETQKKIDLLCLQISDIEWSGTLFYEYEGSWKENNLVIKVIDFYLQDIGNTGYTVFEQTPDVAGYRVDKDLLTAKMGLIHSHHNMAAFFSGTDLNTLASEALDHDHFVSLIVNNKRKYVAAITAVEVIEKKCIVKEKNKFITFEGVEDIIEYEEYEDEIKENKIIYTELEIEIEEYEDSNFELIGRIQELKNKKTVPSSNRYVNSYNDYTNPSFTTANHTFNSNSPFKQLDLFDKPIEFDRPIENTNPFNGFDDKIEQLKNVNNLNLIEIDPSLIEHKVKQIITLSRLLPKSNQLPIHSFIKRFDNYCKESFGGINEFTGFLSFYLEDIIMDYTIIKDPNNVMFAEEEIIYKIAYDILEILNIEAKGHKSEYFDALIEEISMFLIR